MRRQATDFSHAIGLLPAVESLQFDTKLGKARPAASSNRGRPRGRREAREQMLFGSQTRFASPEARFVCDGWCKHSEEPHPNVVGIEHLLLEDSELHICRQLSLSAFSDLQRAWEGPKGSLTTVLCNYLSKRISYNTPYRDLIGGIRGAQSPIIRCSDGSHQVRVSCRLCRSYKGLMCHTYVFTYF